MTVMKARVSEGKIHLVSSGRVNVSRGALGLMFLTLALCNPGVVESEPRAQVGVRASRSPKPSRPSAPVLLAPSGTIADSTPEFTWQKIASATEYRLTVRGNTKVQRTILADDGLCGSTTCSTGALTPLEPGDYAWYLRAVTPEGKSAWSDKLLFTVSLEQEPNEAPSVFAGDDQSIRLSGSAHLDAAVTDDGDPDPPASVAVQWVGVSGPGEVLFANPHEAETTATFSAEGSYVLRLLADDSALTASDDVTISVGPPTSILEVPVRGSFEDAEESGNGTVTTTSTNLPLALDGSVAAVGIRFSDLNLPPGTTIIDGRIQFTANSTSFTSAGLTIHGEATDNAEEFLQSPGNISLRKRTDASVFWTPDVWAASGEAGTAQRTPDISPILSEILDRPGWSTGNAVAVIITGAGERVAHAYDGQPTSAAKLKVEFLPPETPPDVPAFPGAEGFGAKTRGGRGGRILEVTNLNDDGPGSLRAAVDADGPRIVVFRVAGTITLQDEVDIHNPYITIAGQTAPGDGITIRNDPANRSAPLQIHTHDVVVRYLRLRPGPSTELAGALGAVRIFSRDTDVYNVVVDHCSMSWGTDELVNVWYGAHDITLQWNFVSEGLNCSTHEQGCHSNGMLLGETGSHSMTVHHNLFAHVLHRAPRIKTEGTVDVVNNVVYNWADFGSWAPSHITGSPPVNYVGNFAKRGIDTGDTAYFVSASDPTQIYLEGNIAPNRSTDDQDEIDGVIRPGDEQWVVPTRHAAPTVTTDTASQAYERVLSEAGASAGVDCNGNFFPRRDPVDQRIASDVESGTGRIIDDPSEVGGWPELTSGTPCGDSDHDAMPNNWETLHGFEPNNPADGPQDRDGDGYTNVEEYLNGTVP